MTDVRFPWPGDCAGAISLTFDDGRSSQLKIAVPRLNELGLRATFYLTPHEDYDRELAPWREVADAEHELGNHTVNHPCACNHRLTNGADRLVLEDLTLADMEIEVTKASQRLRALVPQQRDLSFAYPCYQSFVGRGLRRQSYVPVVVRHCIAGRGLGEIPFANDPYRCDLAYVWSWPCERMRAAELIGLAEQAVDRGHWGIMVFHGVNDGSLPVAEVDLIGLLTFLARQSDRIWTAPVADVARWIADRRDG